MVKKTNVQANINIIEKHHVTIEPNIKNEEKEDKNVNLEPVKSKRGRKPKNYIIVESINTSVKESEFSNTDKKIHDNETTNISLLVNDNETKPKLSEDEAKEPEENDGKPLGKKRGRKPKGGKIIQHLIPVENQKAEKPNVILHLKCSMKDLQNPNNNNNNNFVDTFNFSNKHELNYHMIATENIKVHNFSNNEKQTTSKNAFIKDDNDCDCDYENDDIKEDGKELWKKLKQLEHNLHINNVNNKRSACFWDTCDFDNPPVYIPKHFINGTYHVYGCFCSPECAVAYLMNESIDSSTKFERYHLLNHIYSKIYEYKKNIKPAPNPFYMLEKYYGNLSIPEYRSLLRNERLFLIVDKPLTRILPELHEDNDEFILNNKIIPSNTTYQLKSRLQKKKAPKTTIFNEKFGIGPSSVAELVE
jgi:hypothetical protein